MTVSSNCFEIFIPAHLLKNCDAAHIKAMGGLRRPILDLHGSHRAIERYLEVRRDKWHGCDTDAIFVPDEQARFTEGSMNNLARNRTAH